MNRNTPQRKRVLSAIMELGLADENILGRLLSPWIKQGSLHVALWRYRTAGLLHRFPKRLPLARNYKISDPNVYILSEAGAETLMVSEEQRRSVAQMYDTIRYSDSHHLMERLDKALIHAALLRGQEAGLFRLTDYEEERWFAIDGTKRRCDVFYELNGTYRVAVEIDSGEERLRSDDKSRRTIEKKVWGYGVIDNSEELDDFRVLFVHAPFIYEDPQRPANLLELCKKDGKINNHRADFYQVCSLRHFRAGLEDPEKLKAPVIRSAGFERLLSIAPPVATVEEPEAARQIPAW